MVTPLFFYAFDNVITTRIVESQMLKTYCVMVNRRFEIVPYAKQEGWWQMTVVHFPNDVQREKRDYLAEIYPTWESAKAAEDAHNTEDVEDGNEKITESGDK